jgi:CelD/BcsL family acetyltransferase involved in cellulose biosynthesis
MKSDITVDVVSAAEGLNALQADWDRLAGSMEVPSPFHSWDWNHTWWETFGGRNQIRVAVLSEAGRIVGIAPFYRLRFGPLHALVPFGWPDRLTELMEPLVPEPGRDRVHAALKAWLLDEQTLGLVTGLDRSVAMLFGDRALCDPVHFDWRWLPPSWDELLDGLGRSMRGNIRYYPRLLQRSGHSLAFRVADDVGSVRAALPILFALHTARADAPTGERHRDRLRDPLRREFLYRLAAVLPRKRQMKIGILEVDGADVAAQLWFEQGGTIFLHYSGYEPEWARFSVAMVATAEIIRLGIERGLERVEFLRGSKQFKTRWNTEQRVHADVYYLRYPWLLPLFHRLRSFRRKLRARSYRRSVAQLAVEPMAERATI